MNPNSLKKRLIVFFTQGVSLKIWDERGFIDREVYFYNQLVKKMGKVTIITYGESDSIYSDRVRGISIMQKKRSIPPKIYSIILPFLLKDGLKKADIYKTNQMNGAWAGVVAKALYRKPLIVRCGYEWKKLIEKRGANKLWIKFISLLESFVYKNADRIILTSNADKKYVCDEYRLEASKVEVIPNYIDTEKFSPNNNIIPEPGRVCFVGRLDKIKNLENLFDAIRYLKGMKLVVVGKGPEEERLRMKADAEDISVEFLDRVPNEELVIEYNKAEICILPSFSEGNPKVLLEAMACGRPVIGSEIEGIKEIISHGHNGYLCKTDARSLSEAINSLIADKEFMVRIGRNARKTILEKHNITEIIDREMAIYEKCLSNETNKGMALL